MKIRHASLDALRLGAAVGFLAMAGTAAAAVERAALDNTIVFADPALCELAEDTAKLFAGFYLNDPAFMHEDGWFRPGTVPDHLRDQFGPITLITHDGWWVVRTETRGSLWTLPLVAIEQDFPRGGDPGGFTLVFDAPVEMVERVVRARGFDARADHSIPMGEPDGYDYEISLEASPKKASESLMSCGYS